MEDARQIFTEKTIEEAYNPKNVGEIDNPDGAARITGPCGDTMQIHLKLDGDVIVDCKFMTDGCGPTIACGSVITELVKGRTVEEASKISEKDILDVLGGLPEEHLHCPVLAVNTLKAAIKELKKKL
ncbi:MAG TPA: iron-sulfur cluster assembly scaffold protein [Methanomicrobia archaeon]|nr:iron-sulfur cluster assembly scaffold protein [Methanomicrobia archaeon]HEX59827.1 iron-sulfur cluster assembly scaffold protein [Methanomicrobia archaeon]